MAKGLIICVLLIIYLSSIHSKCERKQILSISTGTSYGKCIGYCRRSIRIQSTPKYQLTSTKEPNYDQPAYPTVAQQYPFTSNEWKQLLSLFDSKSFQQLDERIGCPDCADGGAEWIEIQWSKNKTKRVKFEKGQLIKGFEGFINELRQLRVQYVDNL